MPVTSVSERWSGTESNETATERTVNREFDVIATRPESGDVLNEIRTDPDIPGVGGAHPRISGYYCQNVGIAQAEGPTKFRVTATYGTTVVGDVTDPLSEPPEASWDALEDQREIDTDLDDEPIASSAGEPFDPPLVESEADPVFVWTKNYSSATVTASWLASFANKTNDASVEIVGETVAIGEALQLGVPRAQFVPGRDGVSAYWRVTFRIALRIGGGAEAWHRRVLDQGYRALNGDDELVMLVDQAAKPLNQPSLLDGTGHKLTAGSPVFLSFRTKGTADFTDLDLA